MPLGPVEWFWFTFFAAGSAGGWLFLVREALKLRKEFRNHTPDPGFESEFDYNKVVKLPDGSGFFVMDIPDEFKPAPPEFTHGTSQLEPRTRANMPVYRPRKKQ